ncbi:MAG: DUF819 domain-containing protein [Steroidobacteraceae bacterium]
MPLIEAEQTFALGAAIMLIVAFGLWAERRRWGQQLGGPLLLLGLAMLSSNLGLIPFSAPVYGTIAGVLVPMAIPLLLMRADFRTIVSESGPMLVAFMVAATVTVIGAVVGAMVLDLGPFEPQIVGSLTASYIGGSLNFVATAEAVGIKDSSIYVASLAADAVGAVIFLLLLMSLPAIRLLREWMPSRFLGASESVAATHAVQSDTPKPFSLAGAAYGLAISLVVCALAEWLTGLLGIGALFILVVTALALVVANLGRSLVRHVSADFELGTLFMYVFFVVIGAGANLGEVLGAALPIVGFIVVMVVVHLLLLIAIGSWWKLDLAEVLIASNACILGPAPAAALAAGRGWQALVAPGILVGMFGYAIATFIGIALAGILGA